MERLTIPRKNCRLHTLLEKGTCIDDSCADLCNMFDGDCDKCPINEVFDRLSAYEDTGHTPEEITSMKITRDIVDKQSKSINKLVQANNQMSKCVREQQEEIASLKAQNEQLRKELDISKHGYVNCTKAERQSDGKCLGYGRGENDDEPCSQCMNCPLCTVEHDEGTEAENGQN